MADMLHHIEIEASPERVCEGITTSLGLRGWWTGDAVAEPRVGGKVELGIYERSVVFRMRVDELELGRRVVWSCLGDDDEWEGTRLVWEMRAIEGGTDLHFAHEGWRSTDGLFAASNTTWGELMYRLKDWAEGEEPGPHFEG